MKIYRLYKSSNAVTPFSVLVKCRGYWQEVSPQYMHEGNARRWAKRNGITLQN